MKKFTLLVLSLLLYQPLTAASVDTVVIYSQAMKRDIKCVVVKPDSYNNEKSYPTVYLLHGYSDSYSSWVTDIPVIKLLADQYNMLLVCPDGGYDSWYFDSQVNKKSQYETHISQEVVSYIDTHYNTRAERKFRAITGLSMGGHGAFYIALKYGDTFGAVGSTSGGVNITPFASKWNIKGQLGNIELNRQEWEKHSIINMVEEYPTDSLAIIFDCGTNDFFFKVNNELHQKMLKLKIPHDYIVRPGGHTLPYWQNSIAYQLLYFHKYFEEANASN